LPSDRAVPPAVYGGGVGEGGLIWATVVQASSTRMAAARYSYSRSTVAARTQARAASNFFFTSAVMATMASSFYMNSVALAAWWASSVAIRCGVMVHREVTHITGDATKGERVAGP
jgi:hypothetical protein